MSGVNVALNKSKKKTNLFNIFFGHGTLVSIQSERFVQSSRGATSHVAIGVTQVYH